MPKPLAPTPASPATGTRAPHEIDLEGLTAGNYFAIGRHQFMAARMNLTTVARVSGPDGADPVRGLDEIDLRLVHAWWKCCND